MDPNVLSRGFGQLGGAEAAQAAWNHFTDPASVEAEQRFDEICLPLYIRTSDTPALQWAITNDALRRYHTEHEAFTEDLHVIQCPVLAVVGQRDPFCSPEALATLHRALPQAEIVVVDDAGHAPYRDQPTEFHQLVRDFIASIDPSTR